jgi:site-specific DNA recombinase
MRNDSAAVSKITRQCGNSRRWLPTAAVSQAPSYWITPAWSRTQIWDFLPPTSIAHGPWLAPSFAPLSASLLSDGSKPQRAKVAAYAELYDLELVETIIDGGESAKSLDRPGLQRALALLKDGTAEALLVVKLDRLTRSVVDLGTLVDRYFAPGKAALLSVGEQIDTRSAAGRLVLNVLASVSQWEREAIGEHTATAMQHKASQGEYTGGQAPYGRRVAADGERLEEDAHEAQARALARELRLQGLSLRGVAAELERRGVRSRTGRGFAPVQVKRMVG